MIYKENIKYESQLDPSIISQSLKGKKIVRNMADIMIKNDIWVLKSLGTNFSFKDIVTFLFKHNLDVFDVEYGSIIRIYVCRKDDYRIQNSVVFSIK